MAKNTANQSVVIQLDRDFREFMVDREARNLSKNTLAWYSNSYKPFRKYFVEQGVTETSAIEPIHLRQWLIHLQKLGHNENGVHNLFGAMRAFFTWYAEEVATKGWDNPLNHVQAPKRSNEILQLISLDNFQRLIDTIQPGQPTYSRDRAILYLLLDTGIRHAELAALVIDDIDLKTGAVLIRKGKGRKTRTVYMGNKTRRTMSAYLRKHPNAKGSDPLWLNSLTNKRITKDGIRQMIARRAGKAGFKEPGLHEFRRAFAVNFLRNGGDVVSLQRLLRHSNLQIINTYLALVDEDLRRSHERFSVVDNLK